MGIFDGFLDKMKLSSDDDDFDADEYDDEDDDLEASLEDDKPAKRPAKKAKTYKEEEPVIENEPERSYTKTSKTYNRPSKPQVRPAAPSGKVVRYNRSGNMEVCVFKPNNIEDGREISDTLLEGKAVVLNLEGIDVALAQRIVDFTSGACYSIRGNLQKITNYIFIVTPESVDISGDFQELLSGSNDYSFQSGNMF